VRLVLDTNVVASALLWSGSPRQLLHYGRVGRVTLITSASLLAELTDILSRVKFEKKIAESLLSVDEIVDLYAELAELVRPTPLPRLAPDPDDDVVIGTAIAAKAEFVVTGDKALLSVEQYKGVRIVSVREALNVVDLNPQTSMSVLRGPQHPTIE
jgi:putative PIN family toxin of toxin-antitoxin system